MIRTLTSDDYGDRAVSLYEVTDPKKREPTYRAWEFVCNVCGEICNNLTEAEARAELDEHVCKEPKP